MFLFTALLVVGICTVENQSGRVVFVKTVAWIVVALAFVVCSLRYAAVRDAKFDIMPPGRAELRKTAPFGTGPAGGDAVAKTDGSEGPGDRAGEPGPRAESPLAEMFRGPDYAMVVVRAATKSARLAPNWWRGRPGALESHDFERTVDLIGDALKQQRVFLQGEDFDEETMRRLVRLQEQVRDFSLQVFLNPPPGWSGDGGGDGDGGGGDGGGDDLVLSVDDRLGVVGLDEGPVTVVHDP